MAMPQIKIGFKPAYNIACFGGGFKLPVLGKALFFGQLFKIIWRLPVFACMLSKYA
jgi:hypothetical protein